MESIDLFVAKGQQAVDGCELRTWHNAGGVDWYSGIYWETPMRGRENLPVVDRREIETGLRSLGLPCGAVVLTHSSLRSLGNVIGGADAVIDAIMEVIGPKGTLVVPTLTFEGFEKAGRRFDARTQPSESGLVTEKLRLRREARRSLHPLSSAAALGADAESITAHHEDTPCGPGSPYWEVWRREGHTLFIGVEFACNSLFHVAEEVAAPAYLTYDFESDVAVTDCGGNVRAGSYRRYACGRLGIVRYLGKLGQVYVNAGVVRTTPIGAASVRLVPAKDNVQLAVDVLRRNPEWILEPESLPLSEPLESNANRSG